jgi:hypothetical protein
MISVASIMRGQPTDFPEKSSKQANNQANNKTIHVDSKTYLVSESDSIEDRYSYFCNWEQQYSTFKPKDYERPGMRFPFYADDPVDSEIADLKLTRVKH